MTELTVRNPDFETVVRESFARQGLMGTLGARVTTVEPGLVEIEVPYAAGLSQQHGFFHAGVTASVVDSSCGYAALTLMPPASEVLSIEFKVNLMAPANGDRLLARGRVVRSGRTVTVCQGDAYAVSRDSETGAETETHCATMVATMMRVDAS